MNIQTAIQGATGYTGAELIRLIDAHPVFQIMHLGAHSQAGRKVSDALPGVSGTIGDTLLASADDPLPDEVELVFTALPHGASARCVQRALNSGKRVVDLSADFRHRDVATYKTAYGVDHPCPELLSEAIYGITEFQKDTLLAEARLVANPGCYPTSALLPLIPLLRAGVLDTGNIIIDSKSGASGAGRSARTELIFCEVNENVRAYGLPKHRHAWEIEEKACFFSDVRACIQFVPHILPMTRGMLSTLHLSGKQPETWCGILMNAFADKPFVCMLAEGQLPSIAGVAGSNRCDIGISVTGPDHAVVISCLDNLIKGAAGQAVQNANLMFGLNEQAGLSRIALWP